MSVYFSKRLSQIERAYSSAIFICIPSPNTEGLNSSTPIVSLTWKKLVSKSFLTNSSSCAKPSSSISSPYSPYSSPSSSLACKAANSSGVKIFIGYSKSKKVPILISAKAAGVLNVVKAKDPNLTSVIISQYKTALSS